MENTEANCVIANIVVYVGLRNKNFGNKIMFKNNFCESPSYFKSRRISQS